MKNYNLIPTGSKSKTKIPHCIHGPNLLLEDLNETIPEYKRKYVCSAVRSNECKPFINFDLEKFKENHFKKRKNFQNRLISTLKSPKEERRWCVDCSILVLASEFEQHQDHFIKDNLTLKQLRLPTKLISANVEKKEEAQYFFSDESLKVILKAIVRSKFTHVLCIGCPSIHEQFLIRFKKLNIASFLLDIDSRYLQFYTSKQFLCFNMANNFLFEKEKYEKNLNQFLAKSSKLLIIADPPFGIMMPALADTLIRLKKRINYFKKDDSEFKMNMMLFHLYFYEKRISNVLPELKMMDYKISYANHKKMKQDSNSIARLFTDIDGKQIVLKGLDGYKYCDECERWVHSVSTHCPDCKNCCSKDGKPSGHCPVCDKCVRETYVHCFTCEICTRKGECKCGYNSKNKLLGAAEYYSDDEFNYYNDQDAEENEVKIEKNNEIGEIDDEEEKNFETNNDTPKDDSFNKPMNGFQPRNGQFNSRNFNGRDRSFNSRDRSFNGKDKSFNGRDRSFNSRDRSFNSRNFNSKDRPFNSRHSGGRDFKARSFGSDGEKRNFRPNRSFEPRKFGDSRNEFKSNGFGDNKFNNEITKDDFNQMFFSKNSTFKNSSKSASRGGSRPFKSNRFNNGRDFKRSNGSFERPSKRGRFNE